MARPDVPSLVKHLCGAGGGALALGGGTAVTGYPAGTQPFSLEHAPIIAWRFLFVCLKGKRPRKGLAV